jgi:ParB/RepB/Spo0J family partition protein
MAKGKKIQSDAEFIAFTRSQREVENASVSVSAGMVMTHPPVGPSKSREEMLAENQSPIAVEEKTKAPEAVEKVVPAFLLKAEIEENLDSKFLPISEIRHSAFQVRSVADPEYIEQLMESIQRSGVISSIVVRPVGKGYEIIAGHHRFEACRRLGHVSVPVEIKVMTDSEAAMALSSDNFVRKELGVYERYKHAKMLYEMEFCKTWREVATVLGVSPAQVTQMNSFDSFPSGAKAILEGKPNLIGYDAASKLEKIAKEEPDLFTEALLQVANEALPQNRIGAWIAAKLKSGSLRMKRSHFIKISRPGLSFPIRLTYTDREAKIQADGLNIDKLQKLIEANLDDLLL